MENIDTTNILIDPFATDFQRRWSWPSLGTALLNAAENHANARGFGMLDTSGVNYTWVLSRLAIEMEEMPKVYDEVCVSTWVESIYRLFSNRNFAIRDVKTGKTYGYARSIWALINYDTRQPADIAQIEGDALQNYAVPETPCPIEPQGRVKPLQDSDFVEDIRARYTDIDQNNHVNSICYVEHILNLFDIAHFQSPHNLRRLEIAYMAESRFGDTLSLFRRKIDDENYEVEIRKNRSGEQKGEPIVRAKLIFQ